MYRAPRGMADRLPDEQSYWRHILGLAAAVCERYGYRRIDTPMVEATEVFQRGVGAATDIVEKEMYSFLDKSGESLTLRPEATAAICRAYLEHGMASLPQPVKLFTTGSFFRYDRPQAGRYRQLHQFNVEAIGEADFALDAEVIEMAVRFFREIGLHDLRLLLNSIGDAECRPGYISALRVYYLDHFEQLCNDCRNRLGKNPLRLLDCKNAVCSRVGDDAPRSVDHLCTACSDHFSGLSAFLGRLGVTFSVDHRLVRGLDYYTRTVFEFQPQDVGGQSTVGGGGRYDGLISQLGGRPTPGIGFAVGIERIILNLKRIGVAPNPDPKPIAFIAALGDAARSEALVQAARLRGAGLAVVSGLGPRSLKAQLRQADGVGARVAIIIGDDEIASGAAIVRDLVSKEQRPVQFADLMSACESIDVQSS